MEQQEFLTKLDSHPGQISFEECIACIDRHYDFSETVFSNGELVNEAGQNSGSCKIFAFAKLLSLDPEQTLACFGHYYRDEVLANPSGSNHQNIRAFMRHGWKGINFQSPALVPKN